MEDSITHGDFASILRAAEKDRLAGILHAAGSVTAKVRQCPKTKAKMVWVPLMHHSIHFG
jgi:hypothetical protein